LAKEDPLFAALETGQPPLNRGPVRVTFEQVPYYSYSDDVDNEAPRFSAIVDFSEKEYVHIDKNSNTVIVGDGGTYSTSLANCLPRLKITHSCGFNWPCPAVRNLIITVGPKFGIDDVVGALPETQRRDRVTFTELKPDQSVSVSISERGDIARPDSPSTFEQLSGILGTSVWEGMELVLLAPLIIFALSQTNRKSLDSVSRAVVSIIILSMACGSLFFWLSGYSFFSEGFYLILSWLRERIFPFVDPLLIENAVAIFTILSLTFLVLLSVFVLLPLALSMLVARSCSQDISRNASILVVTVACGPLVVAAVIQSSAKDLLSLQEVVMAIIVFVLPIMVTTVLMGARRNPILLSALVGILTALFATNMFPNGELSVVMLVLSFTLVAIPVCLLSVRKRLVKTAFLPVLVEVVGVIVLALLGFWHVLEGDSISLYTIGTPTLASPILVTLELALFILIISVMVGKSPATFASDVIMTDRRYVVMILTFFTLIVAGFEFLGIMLSTLLFGFLVIRTGDNGNDLWNVSGPMHRRLIAREARRLIIFKVSRDHARDGKRRMSEGAYDLREFDRNQRIFDRQSDPRQPSGIIQHVSLPEAALGSGGGFTASQNARTASIFALVVCLPTILPELADGWELIPYYSLSLLGTFRWVIYACIFGYYYPAVRGSTPTSKSLVLFVAVAIPEIMWLTASAPTISEFMLPATVLLGQAVVLCFGLGLFWERRLVHAAGMGWGRIRDFRALQGLASPVITIMIATAITIATGLLGTTITSNVQTPDSPNTRGTPPTTEIGPR